VIVDLFPVNFGLEVTFFIVVVMVKFQMNHWSRSVEATGGHTLFGKRKYS
jgi:hypothetical protein